MHLLSLIIGMATLSPATGNIYTSAWKQVPAMSLDTVLPFASDSILHCGIQCAELEWCISFCHDRKTERCHVRAVGTSLTLMTGTDLPKCFDWDPSHCLYSEGYKMYGGRCIKYIPDWKNFTAASERCAEDGGHLYHYKTKEQDQQPYFDLRAENGVYIAPGDAMWMGADDLAVEGVFVWSDGTPLPVGTDLWYSNEPNNYQGNENCVGTAWNGLLNDLGCDAT